MVGAFGLKGEVRITAFTGDPRALLILGPLLDKEGAPVLELAGGRPAKGALIVRVEPPLTREAAERLRGLELFVPRSALPPANEEEFYLVDLIGLEARTPDGAPLGCIKAVQNFGAGDLLEIAPADGAPTWFAPFTDEVVPEVRLAEGFVVVDPPPDAGEDQFSAGPAARLRR